jgi:hypothetical protein
MEGLLNFLSGSIAQVRQWRFINAGDASGWNDPLSEQDMIRDIVQNEFATFFKDDWKVSGDLTLNLGLRYEYFGVPYLKDGLTTGLEGGGAALFGLSGRSIDNWMQPGIRGEETALMFIGPDSPNPDVRAYKRDWSNIGPAVGFAWQLPWLGKGKTTVRGGYQLSYIGNNGRARDLQGVMGWAPGTSFSNSYTGTPADPYIDMTDLPQLVPVPVPADVKPGIAPIPVTDRVQNTLTFDPNYVTPYIQNLTLAVTRNVTNKLSVDVRYIGTLSRKLYGTIDINDPNFLTNGLLEAFNAARAGGESALLDEMLAGQRLATGPAFGPVGTTVNGVLQTGAHHLRNSTINAAAIAVTTPLRQALANGDYASVAEILNYAGFPAGGMLRSSGKFPENFIKTNPQFNNATFLTNSGHANYHSLQTQVTLQPTAGVNFQSTYTWSKNLGMPMPPTSVAVTAFTDPRDRAADYTLLPGHRTHSWVMYGNWDLPIGPGKLLAGDSSGILRRFVEGWQASWIANVVSGAPASISAANMMYGNGVPDVVGDFDFDSVGVDWQHGAAAGNYFGNHYTQVVSDPQCSAVAASLQQFCTLQAIAGANGAIVFQNPQPGKRGNFGQNRIFQPGMWNVDMALAKSIRLTESKGLRVRVDASNIFNRPQVANPNLNINSTSVFGQISSKTGSRSFQMTARFEF